MICSNPFVVLQIGIYVLFVCISYTWFDHSSYTRYEEIIEIYMNTFYSKNKIIRTLIS